MPHDSERVILDQEHGARGKQKKTGGSQDLTLHNS